MIIDGKKIAEKIIKRGDGLKLGVVWIGENKVSAKYIQEKERACLAQGIEFNLFHLNKAEPSAVAQAAEEVDGLIVQLPFSGPVQDVLNAVPAEKDVDMLSEAMAGQFYTNSTHLLPPVVGAVKAILESCSFDLSGKIVAVVGQGRLVGQPLSIWLSRQKATVIKINRETKDISSLCRQADLVVSGVGKPNLIDSIKDGAIVIDAGTSSEDGEIKGDVDFNLVAPKASWITPAIGGVGPLTVACLINNLVEINESRRKDISSN